MDNKFFKQILWDMVKESGFAKNKKMYYKEYDDVYLKIDLQKSNYSDGWYLNYKIIIKELHLEEDLNSEKYDLFGRFLFLINGQQEDLLNVNELNEIELKKLLREGIINVDQILQKGGLKDYCSAYPEKTMASTQWAQEYMLEKGYIEKFKS